jgi:hypothetical protein
MDVMAWIALIMMGCLAGPSGNDRVRRAMPPASADIPGVHVAVATRSRERPSASRAGRRVATPCTAVLGDIDDDETEDDSPSAALLPALDPEIRRAWMRTTARPGSGQLLRPPTRRIPLRC